MEDRANHAPRLRRVSTLALVFVAAIVLWLVPTHAAAHLGSTKRVHVRLTPYGADVLVELDPTDVAWELDLDSPDHPRWPTVQRNGQRVSEWIGSALHVSASGVPCRASAGAPAQIDSDISRVAWAVQVPVTYECGGSASGWGALLLEDAAVFDGDPQHEALVEIDGSVTILRAGRQQLALGSPPSDMEVAGTFLVEGVLHFATGLDHVLFLLGLLLGAGTSIAASGTREAAREIVLVISGFTLGHSLTLALAVLDIVSVPARIVEPAIAASIVVVAAWNFQRPEARRELAYLAATFGLVHGLGFSSILAEILPTHGKTVPLIAFNLGLEVAQLAVVGLALAPLAWSARKVWYRRVVVQGGSALVGCAGLFWLAERLGSS